MLFITNRVFQEGQTPPVLPRSVSFDFNNTQPEQEVNFCRRKSKNNYEEIGSQVFFTELKNSKAKDILIYIHGYSNLPEEAIFPRVKELQELFNQKNDGYMVVVPIIWPCDNDEGPVIDYFDDQIAADYSGIAFARLFQKFLAWREGNKGDPCLKRINLLAHSMGNRVLRSTFNDIIKYFLPQGLPLIFRNIFMAAADVVNEALERGQEGQYISTATRNLVVYYAADDLALRASKIANVANHIASRRLGHTGPQSMDKVNKNVYALDCDDFNNDYDNPTGHGYFAGENSKDTQNLKAGLVFDHLWECIKTGRVPMPKPDDRSAILRRGWLDKLIK